MLDFGAIQGSPRPESWPPSAPVGAQVFQPASIYRRIGDDECVPNCSDPAVITPRQMRVAARRGAAPDRSESESPGHGTDLALSSSQRKNGRHRLDEFNQARLDAPRRQFRFTAPNRPGANV